MLLQKRTRTVVQSYYINNVVLCLINGFISDRWWCGIVMTDVDKTYCSTLLIGVMVGKNLFKHFSVSDLD